MSDSAQSGIRRRSMDDDDAPMAVAASGRLAVWVRSMLVLIAAVLGIIFVVAGSLRPYNPDGTPKKHGTHQGLGLPPCTFYDRTGVPCPSCGFTTSFAFTVRMRLGDAVRANTVGTILAVYCLLAIPWSLISAIRGKYLFVASGEKLLIASIIGFVSAMLIRWGIVAAVILAR